MLIAWGVEFSLDVIPASTKCSQYADDTTLYHHTPVQDLACGVSLTNNALSELHSWSKESNLALNPDKTKSMMFSTRQMFTRRNLSSFPLLLSAGGKDLERVKNTKLLGVHLDENLLWDEHVWNLASSCYSTLARLKKIKHFTSYKLRKHLARHTRLPKSNSTVNLVVPHVSNTFQDTAARIFNTLPSGTKSLWTANNFQNRPLRF